MVDVFIEQKFFFSTLGKKNSCFPLYKEESVTLFPPDLIGGFHVLIFCANTSPILTNQFPF